MMLNDAKSKGCGLCRNKIDVSGCIFSGIQTDPSPHCTPILIPTTQGVPYATSHSFIIMISHENFRPSNSGVIMSEVSVRGGMYKSIRLELDSSGEGFLTHKNQVVSQAECG